MKIFITGAAGFIGQHTVTRLRALPARLRCLVRPGHPRTGWLLDQGAAIVAGDLLHPAALADGMRGCDAVVHLAGRYSMWEQDPRVYWEANRDGTRHVMEAALQESVPLVINVSTALVFGKPAAAPFTEDSAPGPRVFSAYGQSKAAGDAAAAELHRQAGLPLVTLYPGAVVGAGDTKPSGQYLGDLLARRVPVLPFAHSLATYVAVQDVAEAIALILQCAQETGAAAVVGRRYLLGSERLTGEQFARLAAEEAGVPLPRVRAPNWAVLAAARVLTAVSRVTGAPPPWGLSLDAAEVLANGIAFDGSLIARELGLRYTPIRTAIRQAIAAARANPSNGQ